MNNPDEIRWFAPENRHPRLLECPVCRVTRDSIPVLAVPSMAPPHPMLTLLRCAACGSCHYDPPGVTNFADLGQAREDFWRFYVEVGGGVWETVWPLLAERRAGRRTLLDVGCGFGFAVDFWQRVVKGEAIGVELADYGRIGARMLDITVYDQLVEECPSLAGRRFDVVYASEVIEHVPDPGAFLTLLSGYVAPQGVLVLTTPSAEYIRRDMHSPTLHAAIAPGFHGFLLSAPMFETLARRAGFAHVVVRTFGERQILWASHAPLDIDAEPATLLPLFYPYLEMHARDGNPRSPVWQGLVYRYVKHMVGVGRLDEAMALARRLMGSLVDCYGAYVADPREVLARLGQCGELRDIGRVIPYFLPNLYFFLAVLSQHVERSPARARGLYAGTVACTLALCRFGSIFFLEALSFVWQARAREAELCLVQGDFDRGAAMLAQCAAESGDCSERNGFAPVPRDLVEATLPSMCELLAVRGHWGPATVIFTAYSDHVLRSYGEAGTTAAGVRLRAGEGSDHLPLDPLFLPFFAAWQRRRSNDDDAAAATLEEVVVAADALADDPRWGPRARELGDRARRLLPSNIGSATKFSFDFTYTLRPPPS